MTDEDYGTMIEMALEMTWVDAARFIRDEQGVSLMEGIARVENLACQHPNSALAQNLATRPQFRGRRAA
jgi:hypothetical protein